MKKSSAAFRALLAVAAAIPVMAFSSCAKAWQGYDGEDLDKYISYGTLGEIKYVYAEISDAEVEKELEDRLEELAVNTPRSGPFGDGCSALVNAFASAGGEELPQAALNDYLCVAGRTSNAVSDAVTAGLYGKSAGETFTVGVVIPAGVFREVKQETRAEYTVSVLQVFDHTVPDLDDGVCARIFPGSAGAAQIRDEIKAYLKEAREKELNESAAFSVWNEYLAGSYIKKLPYEVYMGFYNSLEYPYEVLAEASDMTVDEYIVSVSGMSKSEFEQSLSSKALEKTKNALLIHATAKNAGIVCDSATVSEYADAVAAGSDGEFENGASYIEYMGEEQVECDCLLEMIFERYTVK